VIKYLKNLNTLPKVKELTSYFVDVHFFYQKLYSSVKSKLPTSKLHVKDVNVCVGCVYSRIDFTCQLAVAATFAKAATASAMARLRAYEN
jgi:hypothetical protein